MRLSAIVAVAENGVIGRDNELPWHLSADLRRFRRLTTGHAIIMGRRTWESIGRPLPERRSIVLTRDPSFRAEGAAVARSLDEALAMCEGESEAFVIGGRAVFEEALPRSERLYLTRVHAEVEGDVLFPEIDWGRWRCVAEERHAADARNDFPHTFFIYEASAAR